MRRVTCNVLYLCRAGALRNITEERKLGVRGWRRKALDREARMEQSRNAYRFLVGKPQGKRPLERPRRRWEDNMKMDLREVGCDSGEWIDLAEYRDQWRVYVRAVTNLWVL